LQDKAIIEKLQQLGFKEYESKVFLVLLKNSILSASDIADKAKIRRTAVYEILKTFAERGYCNEIETNTVLKYEIIDPRIIFDKISKDIRQEKEDQLDQLKETFKELEPLHKIEKNGESTNINI
jgi:sugar-specific transcriptional regulator TrmB